MVTRQQRQEAVLALHPHRQPGAEAETLPQPRAPLEVISRGCVQHLTQLVDLERLIDILSNADRVKSLLLKAIFDIWLEEIKRNISACLGRGQPQLTVVVLLEAGGRVSPLRGRDLQLIPDGDGDLLEAGQVKHRVKPPVPLLVEIGGGQPVCPLHQ